MIVPISNIIRFVGGGNSAIKGAHIPAIRPSKLQNPIDEDLSIVGKRSTMLKYTPTKPMLWPNFVTKTRYGVNDP